MASGRACSTTTRPRTRTSRSSAGMRRTRRVARSPSPSRTRPGFARTPRPSPRRGPGSGAAAQAAGGKVSVLWVDTDGCTSAAQYCKYFLSSVTKNLTDSVTLYATTSAGGTFPTGSYIGDLKNNGTGLAPFHEFESKVPADLKAELAKVKADIISGKIVITSPSQPK